jgi:hypothetical protein
MATSQFTIYTSSDAGGPGLITGITGSLLSVLDACLVNGYGTQPGAGWTKPFANFSGALGCYKQPTGSALTLFVNDGGGNLSAVGQEAWACGYEVLTYLTGSGNGSGVIFTGSYGNGQGFGQFPLPSQLLSTGHVVWRKSTSANTVGRSWIIAADSSSMYLWIQTGDTAGMYYHGAFGDFYSLKGPTDLYRCHIYGRNVENTNGGASSAQDWTDSLSAWNNNNLNALTIAQPGHFLDRNSGGSGASIAYTKKGDSGLGGSCQNNTPASVPIQGILQTPNGADNSLYLSPIWIVEPLNLSYRGRLRGIVQICHPTSNFSDGQIIQGSGDYNGKSYIIIKQGPTSGMWGLETSPTVETN